MSANALKATEEHRDELKVELAKAKERIDILTADLALACMRCDQLQEEIRALGLTQGET